MAYSDDFIRQAERGIKKEGRLEPEKLRAILFSFLDNIPADLCWDIYNRFGESVNTASEDRSKADSLLTLLAAVVDLFEGEYDEKSGLIADEDLKYISEGVNDYALDMSDDILMNVMSVAVSRKLLD